jgi:hypothetical protein
MRKTRVGAVLVLAWTLPFAPAVAVEFGFESSRDPGDSNTVLTCRA